MSGVVSNSCVVCGAEGSMVDTDNGMVCSVCDSELCTVGGKNGE